MSDSAASASDSAWGPDTCSPDAVRVREGSGVCRSSPSDSASESLSGPECGRPVVSVGGGADWTPSNASSPDTVRNASREGSELPSVERVG
ncbi:hypothetical protein [Marinitenerispora sediminis]|uniref:hypothetical protein n=1 Tax=Marinitenerispora sediminis TaxID=1931232 RepID=UPI000DF21FFC|nr:hypothetical protein [Marinitenerispora sediminis]RCV48455.1 hypothetical protein DEF23_25000 [Marinitenerispora sediminis]